MTSHLTEEFSVFYGHVFRSGSYRPLYSFRRISACFSFKVSLTVMKI